jgi:CPA1 family monovalent cation:H+ antiporter
LALSLPVGPKREAILVVTYIIVVFSIIVQGLTIGRLVKADKGLDAEG